MCDVYPMKGTRAGVLSKSPVARRDLYVANVATFSKLSLRLSSQSLLRNSGIEDT